MDYDPTLEHYMQGHIHPDVQPRVRREITEGVYTVAGFLACMDTAQANHDAIDGHNLTGEVEGVPPLKQPDAGFTPSGEYVVLERTPVAQQDFDSRRVDL